MSTPIYKKPTSYMVLALLILLMWFIETAEAETLIEVAPVVAYAGTPQSKQFAILAHERFQDKYSLGVVLLMDAEENRQRGNRGFEALRFAKKGKWEVGLGYTIWAREQSAAWTADNTFTLIVGYNINDRFSCRLRHWSTGGTSTRNSGLDMLMCGASFG